MEINFNELMQLNTKQKQADFLNKIVPYNDDEKLHIAKSILDETIEIIKPLIEKIISPPTYAKVINIKAQEVLTIHIDALDKMYAKIVRSNPEESSIHRERIKGLIKEKETLVAKFTLAYEAYYNQK